MAITQKLKSMDGYFKSTAGDKIILNDLNYISLKDQELLEKSLITIYDNTETISTKPSCDCGKSVGRYLLHRPCPSCGTLVTEVHEKTEPVLWLEALHPSQKFMNPAFWEMIRIFLDKKIDYLRWLCDYKYNPVIAEIPNFIIGIRDTVLGGKREYVNTMSKIEEIFLYLEDHSKFKIEQKQYMLKAFLEIYRTQKDTIFSRYLPIVNKKLFVMENTTKGRFTSLAVSDVLDVVLTWIKCANQYDRQPNLQQSSIATAQAISKLADLYERYLDNYVIKKPGMFRKHVFGARSHFTFRSVITSRPGRHRHDEIIIPWCIATTAFRPHILNKLKKRGYTYKAANALLYAVVKRYDSVVHDIINELIAEAPTGRIAVLSQRNRNSRVPF